MKKKFFLEGVIKLINTSCCEIKKSRFSFGLVFMTTAFVQAQVNTFNRQLIYKTDYSSVDYHAVQQTSDKGYILCRSSVDTLYTPNNHYSEIIRINKTGQNVWRKRFHKGFTSNTVNNSATSVTKTDDGNFVLATSQYDSLNNPQICLLKIDSMGNVMWTKKYLTEGQGIVFCIKQTSDNGFILCGSTKNIITGKHYALAIKTNSNGNFIWGNKSAIDSIGSGFFSVTEIPGQGFAFGGHSYGYATILKTDMNGNTLWSKRFFNSPVNRVHSIIYTSDNSLLVSGWYRPPFSAYSSFFVSKLDMSGNFIWSKDGLQTGLFYGAYGSDLKEKNNDYYFVGYISNPIPSQMIGKISSTGNLVWCKNFYSSFHSFNYTPATIDTTLDGGFVFTTTAGIQLGKYSTAFVKTDANGDAGCDIHNCSLSLNTLTIAPLSGFATSPCGQQTPVTLTLLNLPPNDSLVCETILDLLTTELSELNTLKEIKLFPNPSNGIFKINIEKNIQNGELIVVDLLGKNVYNQSIENGENTIRINGLLNGIYTYKLLENKQLINRGKLIIKDN